MKYYPIKTMVMVVLVLLVISVFASHAQTPQQTLTQYLSDLQKNPNDYALREQIIKHVQTMRSAPAIPEEAKKRLNRGMAAAESAKTEKDYMDAIEEFQKAVTIAPWLGIGYRNLAVIQDKAGQYTQALQNLKLFLLTNPPAADAEAAKTLMDKIEYRQEKAAKESSPQAVAAKKQNTFEDLLKKIDGRRYFYPLPGQNGYAMTIDVSGKFFLLGLVVPPGHANRSNPGGFISYANRPDGRYEIRGRETTVTIPYTQQPPLKEWAVENTYIISENGDRITQRTLFNTGKVGNDMIFLWRKGL